VITEYVWHSLFVKAVFFSVLALSWPLDQKGCEKCSVLGPAVHLILGQVLASSLLHLLSFRHVEMGATMANSPEATASDPEEDSMEPQRVLVRMKAQPLPGDDYHERYENAERTKMALTGYQSIHWRSCAPHSSIEPGKYKNHGDEESGQSPFYRARLLATTTGSALSSHSLPSLASFFLIVPTPVGTNSSSSSDS
jgi:hypothetical protein